MIHTQLKDENLKIAIQKNGRLTEDSLNTLRLMGLDLETYNRKLFAAARNFPVEVLFCRDDDIPGYVKSGIADIGIVGQNIVAEADDEINELMRPGFGYCQVVIAVPKESSIQSVQELDGRTVATSFPTITKKYFQDLGLSVSTTKIAGAVEITPALGVADAIVDVTATGSTLILNDLRKLELIMESEAVMIQSDKKLSQAKQDLITQMTTRLEGVRAAKKLKYVMMNVPKESLDAINQVAPGLDAPTVMELTKPGWLAIHAVIDEDVFWQNVETLKGLGARGILVLSIEKLVP